jgi:soluble lytic murein transglycosylase-like protein
MIACAAPIRASIILGLLGITVFLFSVPARSQQRSRRRAGVRSSHSSAASKPVPPVPEDGKIWLKLTDGTRVLVDEAWEDARGVWYRQSGLTRLVPKDHVSQIERHPQPPEKPTETPSDKPRDVNGSEAKVTASPESNNQAAAATQPPEPNKDALLHNQPVWIYLVGGARVEADEVSESPAGVWYQRESLSIFIERSRIDRVERERIVPKGDAAKRVARGWSTGNRSLDNIIRQNGTRFAVDPYLIFCVMEQESHFNARVVSPKGARGLMQLMPGTGARFGVRHPFSPAENVMGGTRYLKELLQNFGGHVNLVLASYNAGEGAVLKYGGRVPPYRETRNYVMRIGTRYGLYEVAEAPPAPGQANGAPGGSAAKTPSRADVAPRKN